MKRYIKIGKSGHLVMKSVGVTVLAFILSWMIVAPFSLSLSSIFSSPKQTDFILSDFYAQIADKRPVRELSDEILVIDIDRSGREELATLIQSVGLCMPKAVALDVMFEEKREDDSLLLDAISSVPSIVMPLGMEHKGGNLFEISEKPFFYGELGNVAYGAANLPGKYEKSTIREIQVDYPTTDGTVPSFVSAIAGAVSEEAYEKLLSRQNKMETIDYPSVEIPVVSMDEFYSNPEIAEGKVVMIGAINDAADLHETPVASDVAGIMIHAYALSTILEGNFYDRMSKIVDYLVASLLCLFMVVLSLGLKTKLKGFMMRLLQVAFLYIAIRLGYELYVDHKIVIDFSTTFLMITFGFFAIDVWNGVEGLFEIISSRIKKFKDRLSGQEIIEKEV